MPQVRKFGLAQENPASAIFREKRSIRRSEQQDLFSHLEQKALLREQAHLEELEKAAAAHLVVRDAAEVIRQKLQEDALREEQARADRVRREKAERELEQRKREIAEAQRAAEQARKAEEATKARDAANIAARETAERERRAAEESSRRLEQQEAEKASEEAIKQQRQQQQQQQQRQQSSLQSDDARVVSDENVAIHRKYLEIHQQLKTLRKGLTEQADQNPKLKERMGQMRRDIRKSVGQLTGAKGANQKPRETISAILREAVQMADGPQADIELYMVPGRQPIDDPALQQMPPSVPSLLIYLLNIFSKAVINQFIGEAGAAPKTADPIGVLVAVVFSTPDFQWRGLPLIDILLAKYHVVCPVLWGFTSRGRAYGSSAGPAGSSTSGHESGSAGMTDETHYERMTGLGAGFGAIALRNFSKSKKRNPLPNSQYWESLRSIISVPTNEVTQTHLIVLKAMVESYHQRILDCFGNAGMALLKSALVDFPNRIGPGWGPTIAVSVMPEMLRKENRLKLR
ncbi:MAG: hypothetical protein M1825_003065 [Sarcosagium campestre]|nr:MAG: hypothetical protein M1825_003065 [Sarcosagium campestre]